MTAHYRLAHLLGVCDGLRAGAGVAVGVHGHDGDEQHLELVHEGLVLAHRQPQVGLQAVDAHGGVMHHCSKACAAETLKRRPLPAVDASTMLCYAM